MPQKSRATALLALTGDDDLNRYMRKRAERKGMLLNEHGLWKWNFSEASKEAEADSPNNEPSNSSEPSAGVSADGVASAAIGKVDNSSLLATGGYWGMVKTPEEADVFKALEMQLIDPSKRNWGFLSGKSKMRPKPKTFSSSFVGL
jgi:DNA polymerase beta